MNDGIIEIFNRVRDIPHRIALTITEDDYNKAVTEDLEEVRKLGN